MRPSLISSTPDDASRLKVAFIAGSLTQGGAEKQLVYMVRALRQRRVDIRVFTLTRGEFYDAALRADGIEPEWVGRLGAPAARLAVLARCFARHRPHIVQSTHFFSNLYAAIVGRAFGALAIGSIRNDAYFDMQANGRWGPWLLKAPQMLLANSCAARRNTQALGLPPERTHVLSNVIDFVDFDGRQGRGARFRASGDPVAIAVCRVVEAKRLDRFVRALARARRDVPALTGVVVGDGPARASLQALARTLGLEGALTFVGRSDDVPGRLRGADMLVSSSDHEGFPNVVLEAMAARLPVVATPAGDVPRIVEDERTGYVVPFDDIDAMASRMARLAASPDLRLRLGEAGRSRVEEQYSYETLGSRLIAAYREMAERQGHRRALAVLPREPHHTGNLRPFVRDVPLTTR
jgi:glycosyltransferase involved in cell wall biosynthesis